MSVRDLFEKRYADSIEGLSDDVLEIFDFLLEKCDEIEYTRDLQRRRICELERENNVLKIFLADSESLVENSDEISDVLADTDALLERLSLLSELSSLADSISARCKTLRASTDRLQKQREECEISLVTRQAPEYEEGTYLTDDREKYAPNVKEEVEYEPTSPKEPEMTPPPVQEKKTEPKQENKPKSAKSEPIAEMAARGVERREERARRERKTPTREPEPEYDLFCAADNTDESPDPRNDGEDIMDPLALFRSQKPQKNEVPPKKDTAPTEKKPTQKKRSANSDPDDASDIASRLKSMLDKGDVKEQKKTSDDEGYADLIKLFFTNDD